MSSHVSNRIQELFNSFGHSEYGGEAVSQLEHALQTAQLAEINNEGHTLVIACLLHDIGHLLHQLPNDAPDKGIDDLHENLGNEFLKNHFPATITEPVRLHVEAKRYLCTREPEYLAILSQASIVSLQLQGGPMSEEECLKFEKNPHHLAGIKLRRYDDQAKDPEMKTQKLGHYIQLIDTILND